MKVLLTRAASEVQAWVEHLQGEGVQAEAIGLIAILPAQDQQSLHAAWRQLEGFSAVMCVSRHAVEQFFASKPTDAGVEWSFIATNSVAHPRFWATGPGTATALLAQGVAPHRIDSPPGDSEQLDSEALWRVVRSQITGASQHVLMVRGVDEAPSASRSPQGRPWLTEQIEATGARCTTVLAYRRGVPVLSAGQHQRLLTAAQDGTVWVFSSSQAIAHLRQLLPATAWGQARAVATHPRIAQAARGAGFGVVCESRPGLAALVHSIKSMHE